VEETPDTLAFATEAVSTSLGNVLAAAEDRASASDAYEGSQTPQNGQPQQPNSGGGITTTKDGIKVSELPFLDIEIKYGLFQVLQLTTRFVKTKSRLS